MGREILREKEKVLVVSIVFSFCNNVFCSFTESCVSLVAFHFFFFVYKMVFNCSLRVTSPFPTLFSKDLYCRHMKIRACLGKGKPITRRQILDSSKLKEFADDNFKFEENGRKLSKQVENTVGKGEIARNEQFLLFPQCFQKACFSGVSKGVVVWEWVKAFPNDRPNCYSNGGSCLWKNREHLGQKERMWIPALSPVSRRFCEYSFTVVKTWDFVVEISKIYLKS